MKFLDKYKNLAAIYNNPARLLFGNFAGWLGWTFELKNLSAETLTDLPAKAETSKTEHLLIVVHQNPFRLIGGIEEETIKLIKKYGNKIPILLYFFDPEKKLFCLCLIKGRAVGKVIKFAETEPSRILNWIIGNFAVKTAVIESLINHNLAYTKAFSDQQIPVVLLVHDFYYLYFNPRPRVLGSEVPKQLRTWWREIMEIQDLSVVFNSEFTRNEYEKVLNLPNNKEPIVSYPI